MMAPPRPRKQVEYQKPRRINAVSVTLSVILGLLIWAGVSFWPLLVLRSNVSTELAEAIPHLWKLNLRQEAQARSELPKLRKQVIERLRALGVKDNKLDVILERSKQRVTMTARYSAVGSLQGWNRKFVFNFAPSMDTDAARVDW
jgi:predicted PurR-regulated permease PerM